MADDSRGIIPTGSGLNGRTGSTTLAPVDRSVPIRPDNYASRGAVDTGRTVSAVDPSSIPVSTPPAQTPSILGGGATPVSGSSNGPNASGPIYGDSPFGTLADLFLRTFGASQAGGNAATTANAPITAAVPVGTTGGGGSAIWILLLLGAAGFGIYWYYYR